MRKLLLALSLATMMSVVALCQGTVSGPTITLTSNVGAFTPRALVDARGRTFCSFCTFSDNPTHLFRVTIFTADGQAHDARVFRVERFKLSFAIPLIESGITSININGLMINETIPFVSIVSANPVLTNQGFLVPYQNESWNRNIENGVVNKPRNTIKIVLFGSGFGNGGTFVFKMRNKATGAVEEFIGQVLPRSSFDGRDQANWEVPADIPSGVYEVTAYDPNEPGIVSNTIELTIQ